MEFEPIEYKFRCEKKGCHGTTSQKIINYNLKYKSLPYFIVADLRAEVCDKCGEVCCFDGEAATVIDNCIDKEINRRLLALPLGSFVRSKVAAKLLDMSVQQLVSHNRIGRGFVYHVRHNNQEWYNVNSINLYLKNGDGRFPLPQ